MKKKMMILAAIGCVGIGCLIQTIRIIRKLKELKEAKKRTKELEKEFEELKKAYEMSMKMDKIRQEVEEGKKNDPFVAKTRRLCQLANKVSEAKNDEELKEIFVEAEKDGTIHKPWKGDFKEFMSNPNNMLDFS